MTTDRKKHTFAASQFERLETREVLSHLAASVHPHPAHSFHAHASHAQVTVLARPATPAPASPAAVVLAPAVAPPVPAATLTTNGVPTTTDIKNGPMAKLGGDLIRLYQAYLSNHGDMAALKASFPDFIINGDKVSIDVRAKSDVNALASQLINLGMDVTTKSQKYALVSGSIPISQLQTLATLPETLAASPTYRPTTFR